MKLSIILILFLILFSFQWAYAEDTIGILLDPSCRPNTVWKNKRALLENYSGNDFPNAAEWADCKAAYDLRLLRTGEKASIKKEAVRRSQIIDPDFTESSIAIYRQLKVDALDPNGLSIRAVLIYGYLKAQWVITASEQDIGAYDPADDNGWP